VVKSLFIDKEFAYDGSQLRSLFAYLEHKVQGTSIVSWVGACDISNEHMIDGEDLLAGETIAGSRMVHFIIERFETQLFGAVALQRLMAAIVLDLVRERVAKALPNAIAAAAADSKTSKASVGAHAKLIAADIRRDGDDIYIGDGKLSISIATVTPVSALIHFAVNVSNKGTPVKTASLEDLGIDAKKFANDVMKRVVSEVESIETATVKVRWAK
jgi:hypothetical protein